MNKSLLDLNHIPTLDELRAFFKENDFSAAAYMEMDYDTLPPETTEFLEHIKAKIDEHWEPLSHEMGLKSHSSYYGKDNPLIAMRDNHENLIASGVYKLIDEHPGKVAEILREFMDDNGDFTVDADVLLHDAVETTMKVMEYEEITKIVQDNPTYEDFNHDRYNNYRSIDFNRKWNHSRAQVKTVPLSDMERESANSTGIEDEVSSNIKLENFWGSITDEDKKLLNMRMSGMTHTELARELGYKTHSAITKRLQKLKEIFEKSA